MSVLAIPRDAEVYRGYYNNTHATADCLHLIESTEYKHVIQRRGNQDLKVCNNTVCPDVWIYRWITSLRFAVKSSSKEIKQR